MCCCWPFGGIHRNSFLAPAAAAVCITLKLNETRRVNCAWRPSWPSIRECWQLTFVFFLCLKTHWHFISPPQVAPPPAPSSLYILEKSSSGPFRRRWSENLFLQYYFRFSIHIHTFVVCMCLFGLQLIIQPGVPSSVRLINQSTIQSTPDATTTTTKEKMRYPFLSMFLCCCWCN